MNELKRREIAFELRHEDEALRQQASRQRRVRRSLVGKVRQYLNVPYEEREQAKAMGAKWDPERKKWYVVVFRGNRWEPGGYEHWWR